MNLQYDISEDKKSKCSYGISEKKGVILEGVKFSIFDNNTNYNLTGKTIEFSMVAVTKEEVPAEEVENIVGKDEEGEDIIEIITLPLTGNVIYIDGATMIDKDSCEIDENNSNKFDIVFPASASDTAGLFRCCFFIDDEEYPVEGDTFLIEIV